MSGSNDPKWKGGRTIAKKYILIHRPEHPRADGRGYIAEHILIAEKAIRKFLPRKVHIHRVNENGHDNRNSNLVICEDASYHKLLHQRLRIYRACGRTDYRICRYCKNGTLKRIYICTPRERRKELTRITIHVVVNIINADI
jgi:hypothetical protein